MPCPDWLTAQPVAHRGLHDAALGLMENTPPAALAAVEAGFAIECDVQLSADGEAMIFHDFTLDRLTTASGQVDSLNAAELAAVSFKKGEGRIVPLADYLDLIGGRVPLVIEIKSRFNGDLALTRRTAEVVRGRTDPLALMSFDPDIVAALHELAPDRPIGIVAEARYDGEWLKEGVTEERRVELESFLHIDRSRPDFIAWHVKDLPHTVPAMARHFGLPLLTWTVRDADDIKRAKAYADQVIFEGWRP